MKDNPVKALSEFKSNFYDLLLVDIKMPDMNGFELCEKILVMWILMLRFVLCPLGK
jgi:CheY-like chemotaxis protein